jgi:hypothetical protein
VEKAHQAIDNAETNQRTPPYRGQRASSRASGRGDHKGEQVTYGPGDKADMGFFDSEIIQQEAMKLFQGVVNL